MVLFFWRKLMNLLRPSITKILQHRTDDWEAGRKGKWYFPWVFICSSNQNNVRWITTFFIFSLNMPKTFEGVSGKSEKVTKEMTAPWEETALSTILARYQLKDIFNADEFGLFYEALTSKSSYFRGKHCSGGKHTKVQLTGMTASNALGEKIPMFYTGKSASPRCLKHVRNPHCRHRSQKKAWMDGTLFEEWLHELHRKFEMQGRKVVMIALPIQKFYVWKLSIYSFCHQTPLPVHRRWIRG